MTFDELYLGGSYRFCEGEDYPGQELPCFLFQARAFGSVLDLVRGMYVQLAVRLSREGGLAYCLDLPDRAVRPWAIPLHERDLARLTRCARLARLCPTMVMADEQVLDLQEFASDLEHDWTGTVARALAAFNRGQVDAAMEALKPLALEGRIAEASLLYGRCLRERGELREAVRWYRAAIAASRRVMGDRFIPFAAAPLSDMGVAYKRLGEVDKALHCFLFALQLRPNHPEALLTFSSLFTGDEVLGLLWPARVLALGGHQGLVDDFLAGYAHATAQDPATLKLVARRMAQGIDLAHWPFRSDHFASFQAFEHGLDGVSSSVAELASRMRPS